MTYSNKHDTKKLLRECDAGIKMGISSLDGMASKAESPGLEQILKDSKEEHEKLRVKAEMQLNRIKDPGKLPNPIAKGMASVKTELTMKKGTDEDAARLITSSCVKGINSLGRYLDKYEYADMNSKRLTGEIIAAEQQLITELKQYKGR